jgi:hypothetical protein
MIGAVDISSVGALSFSPILVVKNSTFFSSKEPIKSHHFPSLERDILFAAKDKNCNFLTLENGLKQLKRFQGEHE